MPVRGLLSRCRSSQKLNHGSEYIIAVFILADFSFAVLIALVVF